MKSIESVVVAIDGESKCGKTTVISNIAQEAKYQAGIIPSILADPVWSEVLTEKGQQALSVTQERWGFNKVTKISAGNVFRAAALYKALLELGGTPKQAFDNNDADQLRGLLKLDGIEDVLQHDPNVAAQVALVGKMVGGEALCSTILCDYIASAYHAEGGANLVVVDARDPVGHMRRHDLIGFGEEQVNPHSILPIYIDTPIEVAASRMGGDLSAKIAEVSLRRMTDATREDMPVRRPAVLLDDFDDWRMQLFDFNKPEVADPLRIDNGKSVGLDQIQWLGGFVAAQAQDVGLHLYAANNPAA